MKYKTTPSLPLPLISTNPPHTKTQQLVPQEQRNSPRAAKKQYPRNISRKPCVLSAGIASGRGSALLIQLCLLAHAGLLQLCSGTIDPLPLHTPADQGGISTSSKINVQQQQEQGGAVRSLGDVETESGTGAGGRNGVLPVPRVPFCRTGANVANMWMPVWDSGNQVMETAKRVVVSGGKGWVRQSVSQSASCGKARFLSQQSSSAPRGNEQCKSYYQNSRSNEQNSNNNNIDK